jgi:hypothetical protein
VLSERQAQLTEAVLQFQVGQVVRAQVSSAAAVQLCVLQRHWQ